MDSDERATLLQATAVSHPGEVVVDYLEFHDWAQRDLARRDADLQLAVAQHRIGLLDLRRRVDFG